MQSFGDKLKKSTQRDLSFEDCHMFLSFLVWKQFIYILGLYTGLLLYILHGNCEYITILKPSNLYTYYDITGTQNWMQSFIRMYSPVYITLKKTSILQYFSIQNILSIIGYYNRYNCDCIWHIKPHVLQYSYTAVFVHLLVISGNKKGQHLSNQIMLYIKEKSITTFYYH